jgi:hypothetical protein
MDSGGSIPGGGAEILDDGVPPSAA